jgi:hypothetical protein
MIRTYCDGCEKEITEANACAGGPIHCDWRLGTTVKKRGKKLLVEVIITTDDVANTGHWCKYCVLDALYALDDRVKQARNKR